MDLEVTISVFCFFIVNICNQNLLFSNGNVKFALCTKLNQFPSTI